MVRRTIQNAGQNAGRRNPASRIVIIIIQNLPALARRGGGLEQGSGR
jgi:hypothetical protein